MKFRDKYETEVRGVGTKTSRVANQNLSIGEKFGGAFVLSAASDESNTAKTPSDGNLAMGSGTSELMECVSELITKALADMKDTFLQ